MSSEQDAWASALCRSHGVIAAAAAASALTRKQFAWEPVHPSLLEDLKAGNYPA
jgi:hypothetical protein